VPIVLARRSEGRSLGGIQLLAGGRNCCYHPRFRSRLTCFTNAPTPNSLRLGFGLPRAAISKRGFLSIASLRLSCSCAVLYVRLQQCRQRKTACPRGRYSRPTRLPQSHRNQNRTPPRRGRTVAIGIICPPKVVDPFGRKNWRRKQIAIPISRLWATTYSRLPSIGLSAVIVQETMPVVPGAHLNVPARWKDLTHKMRGTSSTVNLDVQRLRPISIFSGRFPKSYYDPEALLRGGSCKEACGGVGGWPAFVSAAFARSAETIPVQLRTRET